MKADPPAEKKDDTGMALLVVFGIAGIGGPLAFLIVFLLIEYFR